MSGSKFCPICGNAVRVAWTPYCSAPCRLEGERRADTQNVERAALERARQARRARIAAEYARTAELTGSYPTNYGPAVVSAAGESSAPGVRHAGLLEVATPSRSRGADELTARIAALGLNHTRAAALLGISQSAVSSYVHASRVPSTPTREAIERVFGVPAEAWLAPALAREAVEP